MKGHRLEGWVAEWLCSGLQSRGRRFDSDRSLHPLPKRGFYLVDRVVFIFLIVLIILDNMLSNC